MSASEIGRQTSRSLCSAGLSFVRRKNESTLCEKFMFQRKNARAPESYMKCRDLSGSILINGGHTARPRMYCSRNRFYLFLKSYSSFLRQKIATRRRGNVVVYNYIIYGGNKKAGINSFFFNPVRARIKIHVLANTSDNIWD